MKKRKRRCSDCLAGWHSIFKDPRLVRMSDKFHVKMTAKTNDKNKAVKFRYCPICGARLRWRKAGVNYMHPEPKPEITIDLEKRWQTHLGKSVGFKRIKLREGIK